jgi:hypothetical protein
MTDRTGELIKKIVALVAIVFAAGGLVVSNNKEHGEMVRQEAALAHADTLMLHRIEALEARAVLEGAVLRGLGRVRCEETPGKARTAGIPCERLEEGR